MARKKQVLVIQDQDPDLDDESPPDMDELRAISEMEGGSDVKWVVMRTSDRGNKKAGYCGTLSTGDVTFEKVAEEWGVGTYRIRGTRSNGQFVKQTTVTISEEPKRATQTLMPTATTGNSVQDMIALMDARADKQAESMLKWAAILTPLLAPVLQNLFAGQKGTTLTELTTALANVKALEGGSKVDQMGEFTKLLELVREVGGGEKTGSTWADIARDGIQQVGPLLGAIAAAKGVKLPPAALPAPQTDQEARAVHAEGENPMLQLMAWLKQQLQALTYQASMNKDPGLYAEVMIDNIPAGTDPKVLLEYLEKSDWWALLTGFHPPVQAYPQWFAECREFLITNLRQMTAPPPEPAEPDAPKAAPAKPTKKGGK